MNWVAGDAPVQLVPDAWSHRVARVFLAQLAKEIHTDTDVGRVICALAFLSDTEFAVVYRRFPGMELLGVRVREEDSLDSAAGILAGKSEVDVAALTLFVGVDEPRMIGEYSDPDSWGIHWLLPDSWIY